MAVEGATRRLAVTGAVICLTVVGLAAAASPGQLTASDPSAWLLGALAVAAVAVLVTAAVVLLLRHPRVTTSRQGHLQETPGLPRTLLLVAVVVAALVWALNRLNDPVKNLQPPAAGGNAPKPPPAVARPGHVGGDIGPWIALIIGVVVVAGLAWVVAAELRRRRPAGAVQLAPAVDPLAAAVEAALLDLEGETDPRRAVIKAYARTESVLREHGLPRHPAEAPLEYLDRVLRELGARAAAVDRLTELFERAAFSQHEVGQDMRDEAIAVFHGLRHEMTIEIIDRPETVEL